MRHHAPSGSATPAVSDRTGDYLVLPVWSPSPPDLYGCPGSRETLARPALSRETMGPRPLGVSDALASATCADLCVSPPGLRRRPSATGRGTSLVLLLSAVLQDLSGQHRQGSAAVAKCRPWFLIFERLTGQRRGEPRALLTSRVARSRLALNPEAVACKERSAQGQTLLAGDQLDSWPGLVCPGTRIDKTINERVGCRGYTETPSQP